MSDDFDWLTLINVRAAIREQFPSLAKVRNERPGCAVDVERKRVFREASEMKRAREARARWDRAVADNARRNERSESRRRAIEYKARRDAQNEMREAS